MKNYIEIMLEIEERLKELANIQPKKDALKYLSKCQQAYQSYHMVKCAAKRHPDFTDLINESYDSVLKSIEEILKEDF